MDFCRLIILSLFVGLINGKFTENSLKVFGGISEDSCGAPDEDNIYYFLIDSSAPVPAGRIHLLTVHYDGQRQMVVTTTAFYNELNQLKNVARNDTFRRLPCPELTNLQTDCEKTFQMTEEQKTKSGWTAWDRGHVTPINPMRFSEDAAANTFYCVNIVPQEPFTNREPWFVVENSTHQYLRTNPGFVMTGVCEDDNEIDGATAENYKVPTCFWKLVCYKEELTGIERVVGFIGNNSLFHRDSQAEMNKRTQETILPRMQHEILALANPGLIAKAWQDAFDYLPDGRGEEILPNPIECFNAQSVPQSVISEWVQFIKDNQSKINLDK